MWDEKNFQALCHRCHSKKTYAEVSEAIKKKKVIDIPGMNIYHIN